MSTLMILFFIRSFRNLALRWHRRGLTKPLGVIWGSVSCPVTLQHGDSWTRGAGDSNHQPNDLEKGSCRNLARQQFSILWKCNWKAIQLINSVCINLFSSKYSEIKNAVQPYQRYSLCLNFSRCLSLLSSCNSLLQSLPSGSPILAGCFEQAIREGFTVAD